MTQCRQSNPSTMSDELPTSHTQSFPSFIYESVVCFVTIMPWKTECCKMIGTLKRNTL